MLDSLTESLNQIVMMTNANLAILGWIILIPTVLVMINPLLGYALLAFGIRPRNPFGLIGIVCAPFLHGDFNHWFNNAIPLVVFSDFLLIHGLPYFIHVTVWITLISGALLWLLGKPGIHVGASGLVTGYFALLFTQMIQQVDLISVLLGGVSLYYFGGIFFGILPGQKGVSWEGHLFGLIAGILVGYFY